MKIYPTIYRYNAPYRGPKNSDELNKLLTSIGHDIDVMHKVIEEHKEFIDENFLFSLYRKEECNSNIETNGLIDGKQANFLSVRELATSINSIENNLDNMLKNL